MNRIRLAILLLLAAPPTLRAVELPVGGPAGEPAEAVDAIDGQTLRLRDGSSLRLVGIAAPLALGQAPAFLADAAERARLALAERGVGALQLVFVGPRQDRYRRVLAHAAREGRWLQGEMVAGGFARAAVEPEHRAWIAELLALEAGARATRRGLWGTRAFQIVPAANPGFLDGFQIVEGRVVSVQDIRNATYLNFGQDWRSDLTVLVPAGLRSRLRAAGLDPARIEGATLRIRGDVRFQNGPMIEIFAPEQVERVR